LRAGNSASRLDRHHRRVAGLVREAVIHVISETFDCYLVSKDNDGKTSAQVTRKPLIDLPAAEVLIRVAWSSLNYKDALSASGHPGVTRTFPHVPGIDASGVVVRSQSPMVEEGEEVLVTGFDLGQNTWGGFAEYIQVPADWVLPLPDGLDLRTAMIYGTAGLTAGQCVEALQRQGIEPDHGEIVVTGASGGVGSMAVAILSQLGYQVVAVSGKRDAEEYLLTLGARRVIAREEVNDASRKPTLAPRWAGAVDTVGGNTLTTLIRSVEHNGCVAACGLVGGADLPLTVYPFILRGVTLAGIDSVECPLETRTRIWHNLADSWKPKHLDQICTDEVTLDQLDHRIEQILAGRIKGRVIVRPTDSRSDETE
jgi:acrylyl-CoA reductase (NADPH)